MSDCDGCDVPITVDLKLSKPKCTSEIERTRSDGVAVVLSRCGELMHFMRWTRLDLPFTVSECSQFLQNHSSQHWKPAKPALRYVIKTLEYGLGIGGVELMGIVLE